MNLKHHLSSVLSKNKTIFKGKYIILLLTLFTVFSINAQQIYYTHNNKSLKEVTTPKTKWKPYNKPIYNGIDNGIYWFKIELQKNTPQILSIPESHISRVNLYYKNKELEREKDTRYVTYIIDNQNNKLQTYYLKVNCLLEGRVPLKIKDYKTFYKNEIKNYIHIGIYTGIVFCIILINLISYFTLKNITYLYYIFMVIGMAVNAFYKDGITALIFGIQGINETNEMTLSAIVVISSIFFTSSYLSLNQHLPKLKKFGIAMVILAILSNLTYQISKNFIAFTTTNILYLLALDIFWISGVLLWKKSSDARFFTVAYGLPLLFVHDYYISPHLGIYLFNLPLYFYKIGSIFEMIVFTYAIMYQSKRIKKENKIIREKLIDYTNKFKEQNLDINKGVVTSEELIKQYEFTIREIDVLKKVSSNKTNKKIASELFISENTVKFHIRNILQKLEVKNRKAASKKYLNLIKS